MSAAIGCVLLAGAYFGVGWYGSSQMLNIAPQQIQYDQSVQALHGDQYVLQGGAYDIDGLVGGIREDGSTMGIFGAPSELNAETKTSSRPLQEPHGELPKVNERISLQGNIWTTNPKEAFGIEYNTVSYPGPLGNMSAWQVPAENNKNWVIGVHGVGAPLSELLRFIKPLHNMGSNVLAINYRNDAGNPASPDGYNHLGDTEWQDVQAAVQYAERQGAEDISLLGLSLGGSIVENYLRRAPQEETARIGRVVLDSPVVDWEDFVAYRLKSQGYPGFLAIPGKTLAYLRAGIDLKKVSTPPGSLRQKTLIIHNSDDRTVPYGPSKKLAEAQPDLATFYNFERGGHTRAWNHDPQRYEEILTTFLPH